MVGSFNFPESMLLADIYAGALRAGGFRASVEAEAGPREIIDPALAGGIVDIVPRVYTRIRALVTQRFSMVDDSCSSDQREPSEERS